jgi:excisionase family DNA binding protein
MDLALLTVEDLTLLTVKEVAEILGISRRTVYNWIDCGVIRAVKVNDTDKSAVRIPLSEVERILKEAFEDDKKVESILKRHEDIIKPKRRHNNDIEYTQ